MSKITNHRLMSSYVELYLNIIKNKLNPDKTLICNCVASSSNKRVHRHYGFHVVRRCSSFKSCHCNRLLIAKQQIAIGIYKSGLAVTVCCYVRAIVEDFLRCRHRYMYRHRHVWFEFASVSCKRRFILVFFFFSTNFSYWKYCKSYNEHCPIVRIK